MFCSVCGESRSDVDFTVCTSCAKLMCAGCRHQHDYVFRGQGKTSQGFHDTAQLSQLYKFFEDCNANRNVKCANKHDKAADYYCEVCQEFTCHTCLALEHQHHHAEKLKFFAPQIQRALAGCADMLSKKRKKTLSCVNSLHQISVETDDAIENTERVIHRAAKEILFQFSAALRKQEEFLKKKFTTQLYKQRDEIKGQIESANVFLSIFKEAQDVVAELQTSKAVPLERDLFANLGVLNKFDVNRILTKDMKPTVINIPRMESIPEAELENMCTKLLCIESMPIPRTRSSKQTPLNGQSKFNPGREVNDEEDSVGETDIELGEYQLTGNPSKLTFRSSDSSDSSNKDKRHYDVIKKIRRNQFPVTLERDEHYHTFTSNRRSTLDIVETQKRGHPKHNRKASLYANGLTSRSQSNLYGNKFHHSPTMENGLTSKSASRIEFDDDNGKSQDKTVEFIKTISKERNRSKPDSSSQVTKMTNRRQRMDYGDAIQPTHKLHQHDKRTYRAKTEYHSKVSAKIDAMTDVNYEQKHKKNKELLSTAKEQLLRNPKLKSPRL